MAFVVEEIGRRATIDEAAHAERHYFAYDYSDETTATAAVLAYLIAELGDPPDIGALTLRSIKVDESEVAGSWRAVATWGVYERKTATAEGGNDFAFEFELETVHVNTSIATTPYDLPSFTTLPAPDIGRAIGWNPKDKTVAGIDIDEAVYGWSETHYFPLAALTAAYKEAIADTVGKVNSATFRGYPAGEVRCLAPTGRQRGANDVGINFRFKQRRNQSISFGGATISKKGWERLEILYDKSDAVMPGVFLLPNPIGAYVQQVFETDDFSGLNI